MKELLKKEKVQRALVFLKEDDDRTLQETLEMCQIPAPSYQEEKKAEYVENFSTGYLSSPVFGGRRLRAAGKKEF